MTDIFKFILSNYILKAILTIVLVFIIIGSILYFNSQLLYGLLISIFLFPFFSLARNISLLFSKRTDNHYAFLFVIDFFLLIFNGSLLLLSNTGNNVQYPYSIYTIWTWYIISTSAYFITVYKNKRLPGIIELILNFALLAGFLINVLICTTDIETALFACIWFALFYLIAFIKNQESIIEKFKNKYL